MAKLYQLIERPKGSGDKWKFSAHGARYNKADALERVATGEKYGIERRLIGI